MNTAVKEAATSVGALKKLLTLGFVNYGTGVRKPFDTIYAAQKEVKPADITAGRVDALVIWGGSDISPTIYNEPVAGAQASEKLSIRDEVEVDVCKAAIAKGIPIIGICRGAQLLCAMAGGKLYQDVRGHHGDHQIVTKDGETYVTSSIHHQMMDVRTMKEDDYELIAWTNRPIAPEVQGALEPEIVYFPKIKGLAIQGHPEFMHPDCDFVEYSRKLVEDYLVKGITA